MRTSKRDRNYLSIGTADNIVVLDGQADYRKLEDVPSLLSSAPPDVAYDSCLKIADDAHNLTVGSPGLPVQIPQGLEGAVDMANRVSHVRLTAEAGKAGEVGDRVESIKGGCHDIKSSILMRSRGRFCDSIVGDWDDECLAPSHGIKLDHRHEDGKPVRVAVGWAYDVTVGPGCEKLFWLSLGVKAYWLGKFCLVKTIFTWFPSLNKQQGT
mgnify:CR=1 FL=1